MPAYWQRWYPHQIDAWQGSATVQALSDAGYRAFHHLLMEQYQQPDGMLPDDDAQLAKISRSCVQWSMAREGLPTIADEVRSAFKSDGNGRIFHARQLQEWKRAQEVHEAKKNAGQLGGRKSAQLRADTLSKKKRRARSGSTTKQNLSGDTANLDTDTDTVTVTCGPPLPLPQAGGRRADGEPWVNAAKSVASQCAITSSKVVRALCKVIKLRVQNGDQEISLCQSLVRAWKEYNEIKPLLRFQWGPAAFFEEGHWQCDSRWPIDNERAEHLQRSKLGM